MYCRLISGRQIDVSKKIGITIPAQFWDAKNEKIKNAYNFENRDKINAKLYNLKGKITNKFNYDSISGEVIDGQWLELAINEAFEKKAVVRGKIESWKVYFIEFCNYWLDNDGKNCNGHASYGVFIIHLSNFLKSNNQAKIKIKDVTHTTIEQFVSYMLSENYSFQTTKRHATRFKFFLTKADHSNLEVNKNYKEPIKINQDQEEVKEIYLNEQEIESVYNLDYSHNLMLDNIRDNFIIGLCTGLRVSDFNNNLNQTNFIDGFIEIKTKKTGSIVAIPLHRYVIEILNKRSGNLPKKVNDVQFNESIKIVCFDAEIKEKCTGYLFDAKTKRNKLGVHEKYKLVSSHICRRSFATNLFGKVPNYVIQAVGGWSTETMMLHYIKKSNREQAEELKKYWDNQI